MSENQSKVVGVVSDELRKQMNELTKEKKLLKVDFEHRVKLLGINIAHEILQQTKSTQEAEQMMESRTELGMSGLQVELDKVQEELRNKHKVLWKQVTDLFGLPEDLHLELDALTGEVSISELDNHNCSTCHKHGDCPAETLKKIIGLH
jgi:cell division protein ZapA (FtsZ GTPase activity inhibitor)